MSLLDDVSIVVTPNGYKAGELYAVIPVPTEGAEEITNGDFATDTNWTKGTGWTISGGSLNGSSSTSSTYQNNGLVNGTMYIATYIVSNYVSGSVQIKLGGSLGQARTSNGTYTEVLTATQVITWLVGNNFTGSIDNVSVKEYTSADMDVTRATAATRVDENGLVNYAEIVGGEEITNADFSGGSTGWTVTNSDADNYVVFDGSTARLKFLNVSPVTTLNSSFLFTSGKTYKLVVDVASVTSGGVKIDGSGISEVFDTAGVNTRIIQATGSGTLGFYRATANVDLTFNSVSLKEVTRDNVPRIDYTGGGCPHILSEPQRTNLIPYSEDFSNADWIKSAASVVSGFTSPDGTDNAFKLVEDTSTGIHRISVDGITVVTEKYSVSIYAKSDGRNEIRVSLVNYFSNGTDAYFNLDTKVITLGSLAENGLIETLSNGWFRCSFTSKNVAFAGGNAKVYIDTALNGSTSYTGDGTSGVYIYGAQLEEGSYPTSYIPTSGSAVTRNQDQFTRDGIGSLINSTEGVLFVEMAALGSDLTTKSVSY